MNKNISKYFDKVYIINLKEAKNRNKHIKQFLNNLNIINYEIKEQELQTTVPVGVEIHPGAYGLWKAMMNILEEAKKNNFKKILIIEDDCCLLNETEGEYKLANKEMSKVLEQNLDYNLLLFGFYPLVKFKTLNDSTSYLQQKDEPYKKFKPWVCTQMVAYDVEESYKIFKQEFNNGKPKEAIDLIIPKKITNKVFAMKNYCFTQLQEKSYIGNDIDFKEKMINAHGKYVKND